MARAALRAVGTPRTIERQERLSLGMAQLSPFGLSEQWLLRDGGDRHWILIADALGQPGIAFRDDGGHPVYAAFCATELTLERPTAPLLGQRIEIASRLHDVAQNRIGSEHRITGPHGPLAILRMISCFLRHGASGSNRKLLRSSLPGLQDLPEAPPALSAFHDTARHRARLARLSVQPGLESARYKPQPALDFNAAGLLYFPTFSRVAEIAHPAVAPLRRREVIYLGNIEPGDTINAHRAGDEITLLSQGQPLGLIRTRRFDP